VTHRSPTPKTQDPTPVSFDVITFDCYGTLIDWEAGIIRAFQQAGAADGKEFEPRAIVAAHAVIEPEVQARGYQRYRDVLRGVAVEMAARLGWSLPHARAGFLAESVPRWEPFADTNAALERLAQAGYRLGILSNIDDDLLGGTRRHFTVDFDIIVTAEQVRSYKPASPHFEEARRRIGDARWLHAAASYFHDVEPAVQHDVPVVWVNRTRSRPMGAARPDAEVEDLAELADLLSRGFPESRRGS
jgi:2-haloalkanoic acid dehalogenase type II